MHQKMPIKLKNWKLAILAVVCISFLASLGFWQLARAKWKAGLLKSYAERMVHKPLTAQDISSPGDIRFYRVELTGSFDNQHNILLDNKIQNGKVGYEVFTPFQADGMTVTILVDRGFLPMGADRKILPTIAPITGKVHILGLLNLPPTYVALGQINESPTISWPLRAEFIQTTLLEPFLQTKLFPYIVSLDPKNPGAFNMEWQIVAIGPERHLGYAVQWFALALTLLIISVALNKNKK
jgi:surfeit locus 1 family protein